MKKIVTIILIILVLAAGAWLVWRWTGGPNDINPPAISDENGEGGLFFPTGQVDNGQGNNTNDNLTVGNNSASSTTGNTSNSANSNFNKISERPVVGATLVASSSVVYMDKATGHLYVADIDNLLAPWQITNTTIPKVNQFLAGQTKEGLAIIARYLKDDQVQNFSANLVNAFGSSTAPFQIQGEEIAELRGAFLGPNIYEMVSAPKQDRIFYLEKTSRNQTAGYLAKWDGSGKAPLFSSPLKEWLATWPNDDLIALQTKTASAIDGSLYLIDLKTKKNRLVFSGIPGLTALVSPNGKKTLYSGNTSQGSVFGVYTLADGFFDRLPITTLAEKCVWSSNNITIYCGVPQRLPSTVLPDDWYQGVIAFADNLWKIDTNTKQAEIVYNPSIARLGQEIDATNLFLDRDETNLFLVNKRDQQLWTLTLERAFISPAASNSDETTIPAR